MGKFFTFIIALSLWPVAGMAQFLPSPDGSRSSPSSSHSREQQTENDSVEDATMGYTGSGEIASAALTFICPRPSEPNRHGLRIVVTVSPEVENSCKFTAIKDVNTEENRFEKSERNRKPPKEIKNFDVRTNINKEFGCVQAASDVVMYSRGCPDGQAFNCGYNLAAGKAITNDAGYEYYNYGRIENSDKNHASILWNSRKCEDIIRNTLRALDNPKATTDWDPTHRCIDGIDCESRGMNAFYDKEKIPPAPPVVVAPPAPPPPPVIVAPPAPPPIPDLQLPDVAEVCRQFEGQLPPASEKDKEYCNEVQACLNSGAFTSTCGGDDCNSGQPPTLQMCNATYTKFCQYADQGACNVGSLFSGTSSMGSQVSSGPQISPDTAKAIADAKSALQTFKTALGQDPQNVMACGLYRLRQNGGNCTPNPTYNSFKKLEGWLDNPTPGASAYSSTALKGRYNTDLNKTDAATFFTTYNGVTVTPQLKTAYTQLQTAITNLTSAGFFDIVAASGRTSVRSARGADLDRYDAVSKITGYNDSHSQPLSCLPVPNIHDAKNRAKFLNAIIADQKRVRNLMIAHATCQAKFGSGTHTTRQHSTTH